MKKVLCILLTFLLAASLFGCKNGDKKERYSETVYDAFDTVTTVTVYDTDKKSFEAHLKQFTDRLNYYDKLFSIYDDFDGAVNLKKINETAAAAPVEADSDIIALLKYSKDFCDKTGNTVNICMGPVLKLWHEAREVATNAPEKAYVPDMKELKKAAEHTDINKLIIDEEKNTVFFEDKEMSLDVGATAKGFAAQLLSDYISKNALWSDYAISIGGNVITAGFKNADGSTKWSVQLEKPEEDKSQAETLSVSGEAVVTSGNYQRYFTVNGKKYCHIIDPETLMPAEDFCSVSVVTDNGSDLADVLSTALFILPLEEGQKLIQSIDDTEAVWTSADGKKTYSPGFKDYIEHEEA